MLLSPTNIGFLDVGLQLISFIEDILKAIGPFDLAYSH